MDFGWSDVLVNIIQRKFEIFFFFSSKLERPCGRDGAV